MKVRGFTLAELLVIIAVLMGVLAPPLRVAREHGQWALLG